MRTNRATVAAQILKGMQLPTLQYPLAAALSDLEAYYEAGTITGAILNSNESVGTQEHTTRRSPRTTSFCPPAARRPRDGHHQKAFSSRPVPADRSTPPTARSFST